MTTDSLRYSEFSTSARRPVVGARRAVNRTARCPRTPRLGLIQLNLVTVDGCPYCDILSGAAHGPPRFLDDEEFVAFVGRRQPGGPGYALVIPRAHVENLHGLPPTQLGPMLAVVQRFDRGGVRVRGNRHNGPAEQRPAGSADRAPSLSRCAEVRG